MLLTLAGDASRSPAASPRPRPRSPTRRPYGCRTPPCLPPLRSPLPPLCSLLRHLASARALQMGRLKALGASDVPTPSRVQPTRPRTSSVRYDPSEISAAPRQAHLPHKSRVEPGSQPKRRPQSQPRPKPAARKTVKGRVGLTDDATSTATGGNVTLRGKVLAAVLRLSRERRKGKEGVGHSSVNLYRAFLVPSTPQLVVRSQADTNSCTAQSPSTRLRGRRRIRAALPRASSRRSRSSSVKASSPRVRAKAAPSLSSPRSSRASSSCATSRCVLFAAAYRSKNVC